MERVLKRARAGEVMSFDYLYKCNEMHERWLNGQKNILTLNGEIEFKESFQEHLSEIEKMLITETARI